MADLPAPRSSCAHLDLAGDVPTVVVDVPEWLDAATAPHLRALLDEALALAPTRVAVDLHRCPAADAYGLGVLERAAQRARAQGTELVVVGANDRVRRVLRLLRLGDRLPLDDRASVR